MKLKLLRGISEFFYSIGSWFEDRADEIDVEFQNELTASMNSWPSRYLYHENCPGGDGHNCICDPGLENGMLVAERNAGEYPDSERPHTDLYSDGTTGLQNSTSEGIAKYRPEMFEKSSK